MKNGGNNGKLYTLEARLHFDIYDFEGESKVDYFNLGDLLRSLDLRPTQAMIEKSGGTKKKGIDHFLSTLLVFQFLAELLYLRRKEDVIRRIPSDL